jgi:uncharacterized protein (TIGR02270 family)
MRASKSVVFSVVEQHAEEAGFLWMQRRNAVVAPNVTLRHLARLEERLEAHLDGVRIAGGAGDAACLRQLAGGEPGPLFVATVLAVEAGAAERLERLLTLAEALPQAHTGLFAAFGWSKSSDLRGTVATMLISPSAFRRLAGTVACSMHRVDSGIISGRLLEDPDPAVRARSLRATGELGRQEFVSRLLDWIEDEDPRCQFWACWSAVLLGDRNKAHERLLSAGLSDGPERARAFQLALMSMEGHGAHNVLQRLARDADDEVARRNLILGTGLAGDPRYVGWLIGQMKDERFARLAGESFSLITGVDLTALNLRYLRPDLETGPTDNPEDDNVDMDVDEGLAWPDAVKVESWWRVQSHRFQAGVRYFMGSALNPDVCQQVLRNGYQRQRILAAQHLCLLEPGTSLFNTSAPAWRQQGLLTQMR